VRTRLSSLTVAVSALLAACTSDHALTAPSNPTTSAALQTEVRHIVIDPTHLPFAGTATERAGGHYVFEIRDSVPTLASGDYVAGNQGALYWGRVLSVSQSQGRLTIDLAPVPFKEVFPSLEVRIPFTPGAGSAPSPYGTVRWGPWERVSHGGQKRGISAAVTALGSGPADTVPFNPIDFFINNFDLCAASTGTGIVVNGCANVGAQLVAAHFALTGAAEVGIKFRETLVPPSVGVDAFAVVHDTLNADMTFQLSGQGSVGLDIPVPDAAFARAFSIPGTGISGELEVGIIVGVEGNVGGTKIQPHIAVSDTVDAGGSISTDNGIHFQPPNGFGHFDAGVKVVDLGELGVKLSVGPKVKVRLDVAAGKVEFEAKVDRFAQAQENVGGLFGIENWHVHVDVGTEAGLSDSLDIGLFGLNTGLALNFPFQTVRLLDVWGTGNLDLASSTTGTDIFPGQQYPTSVARTMPINPPPWSVVLSRTLRVNDQYLFRGGVLCRQFLPGAPLIPPFIEAPQDCNLVATEHTVDLTGIAWNCTAAQPLPAHVQLKPQNPFDPTIRLTSLTLGVVCRSAYAVVRDTVAAMLARGAINIGGIATALDAKLTAAETARNAGDAPGADSALVDLANQLSAQNGKHISITADAELQAYDTLLRDCYEWVVPRCSAVPPPAPLALRTPGP